MEYPREVVEELNNLSFQVFGVKSKWRKMLEKGVAELVEEDTKKLTVVNGKESTETVKTPVLHKDQLHQYNLKKYSVESVREFMLMVLDRKEQVRQAIKRIEEQKKAEEAAKKVAEEASGTAV